MLKAAILIVVVHRIFAGKQENRLLNNLMDKYQKYERPVADETSPVNLNFTLSLQQIIDLDERNQLLITNLWLNYIWTDVNLIWNEVKYVIQILQ